MVICCCAERPFSASKLCSAGGLCDCFSLANTSWRFTTRVLWSSCFCFAIQVQGGGNGQGLENGLVKNVHPTWVFWESLMMKWYIDRGRRTMLGKRGRARGGSSRLGCLNINCSEGHFVGNSPKLKAAETSPVPVPWSSWSTAGWQRAARALWWVKCSWRADGIWCTEELVAGSRDEFHTQLVCLEVKD